MTQVAWVDQWKPVKVTNIEKFTYPGRGAVVEWEQHYDIMETMTPVYAKHRLAIDEWLHSDRFAADVAKIFRKVDRDRKGKLDWNKGEIRMFMSKVFEEKDWPYLPAEFDMYTLYREFDVNHDYALELDECLNFAHAVVAVLRRSLN